MAFQQWDVTAKSDFAQDGQQPSSQKQGRRRGGRNSSAGSIDALADAAVRKLNSIEPKLQLAGQELQFVAQREPVHSLVENPTLHSLHSHCYSCQGGLPTLLLLPRRTPNTLFTAHLWTDSNITARKAVTSRAVAAIQVTLFIGNLTQEWREEQTLHTELSKHGCLERLFIAKAADGSHKVISTCHIAELQASVQAVLIGLWSLTKTCLQGDPSIHSG